MTQSSWRYRCSVPSVDWAARRPVTRLLQLPGMTTGFVWSLRVGVRRFQCLSQSQLTSDRSADHNMSSCRSVRGPQCFISPQKSAKGPRVQAPSSTWRACPLEPGEFPLQGEPPRVGTLSVRDFVAPEHQLRATRHCTRPSSVWKTQRTTATRIQAAAEVLQPAAEAAELGRVTWHQLRHIHSSLLNDLRVPVKIAHEQLGHSSISTTLNIYTHVGDASHRKAIEALERELFPTVPNCRTARSRPIRATRDFL